MMLKSGPTAFPDSRVAVGGAMLVLILAMQMLASLNG